MQNRGASIRLTLFFRSNRTYPKRESELPVWNELDEDPTALRKLSLVHELRLRAAQSPTAGVGAIDVVESLALARTQPSFSSDTS